VNAKTASEEAAEAPPVATPSLAPEAALLPSFVGGTLLSWFQAETLLEAARGERSSARLSLDLGVSQIEAEVTDAGATLDGHTLSWAQVEWLSQQKNVAFEWLDGELTPVRAYSEAFSRMYQLMPTESSPALLLSGFTMHRFRDVSPVAGAQAMVKAVLPFKGALLDTATGLGYAAIEAARHATRVTTIELDVTVQQLAAKNAWSRGLFDNPKLERRLGNSAELVCDLPDSGFAAVVHDPPAINLAGELYAESFYLELHRVLSRGGKLFHYIGDPNSDSGGRTTKGVVRRLLAAGFSKVTPLPSAFGVLARK
jgi:predicted methyltransferase